MRYTLQNTSIKNPVRPPVWHSRHKMSLHSALESACGNIATRKFSVAPIPYVTILGSGEAGPRNVQCAGANKSATWYSTRRGMNTAQNTMRTPIVVKSRR